MRKLSIVDDTLEVLGIPKNYQLLHKWMIGVIIGWILLACFLNTLDGVWIYYEQLNIITACLPFFLNYLLHVNTYNGLIWGVILGSVHVLCKAISNCDL